ncbi:PepSY domain-containing protein [Nocardioides pantholopis]|uniref:PepSY domain-containing protein n=1 Tax=Nocardioides pantholopis TaxID=2483798 RepID=UPI000F090A7A|nr:PepSY domain-containing protein [Nocardioides pantholopis]
MNRPTLRSKRVVLPAIAAVAVLGIGGTVWTATADDGGERVGGAERDRIGAAATEAVGGTVVDVETSDDRGEAYEVEVRLEDGSEVDVALDEDLTVVREETDGPDGEDEDGDETDDRPVTDAERGAAEEAALGAVEGGTVLDVEVSDDAGAAFEVEVVDAEQAEWDVVLDADYAVLRTDPDDTDDTADSDSDD